MRHRRTLSYADRGRPLTAPVPSALAGATRSEIADLLAGMSDDEAIALYYDWAGVWRRENQIPPPGDWSIWLCMAGRGFGKTRVGAEWIIDGARQGLQRMRIIARTAADIRNTCIEGESGILECSPPDFYPKWEPSKTKLTWPNGATALTFAAEKPAKLRGPQSTRDWWDEVAAWDRNPREAISNAMLGLRLGSDPRAVATTTPQPKRVIKDLVAGAFGDCVTTGGSTYDNLDNLAPAFRKVILAMEGTSLADQELRGKLLEEAKGALWRRAIIDPHRVREAPQLIRAAVALDPNVKNNPESDEAGIVWGGADNQSPPHFYVCGDLSTPDGPATWPKLTVDCWDVNRLDSIVYEANQGGDLVRDALRNHWRNLRRGGELPIRSVHATRGKRVRAEPIVTLYEQGRVHHVSAYDTPERGNPLEYLEDQLCTWVPGDADSPGRLDALVWLITFLSKGAVAGVAPADASTGSRHRV